MLEYENKTNDYYQNSRPDIMKHVPKNLAKALDVGCAGGDFGLQLKNERKAEVWGIEPMESPAQKAEKRLDKVLIGKCEEKILEVPDHYFDAIFFNDVLEHLENPYQLLNIVKNKLSPEGIVISSIPNMRYYKALTELLFKKDWKYKKSGVQDFTHLRFFTGKSIKRMYQEQGYEVLLHKGINASPSLRPVLLNIPVLFTAYDIFYKQYLTIARPNP